MYSAAFLLSTNIGVVAYSLLLKMLFCFANVSIITIQTSILLEKV